MSLFIGSGVYAVWQYAELPPDNAEGTLNEIQTWVADYPTEGYDFDSLITALISEDDGLNNSDSFLNKYVNARRTGGSVWKGWTYINCYRSSNTLGSMALSGDLDDMFSSQNNNIDFLFYFYSDTEYYIYTMADGVLPANGQGNDYKNGNVIIYPVWRTKIVYEDTNGDGTADTWVRKEDKQGWAKSGYYYQNKMLASNVYADKISSIEPTSWQEGSPSA